ncbi:heptaprenyl diphosphate synthase component 1 [Virgibacillus xinjiangensis]|uniref:Heptaprenyl diphosphate synthase component 1 n=1 Tax=Virgibacillus xinjiangensis TaxID=393090 RepID=A0ABV7CRD4_9BACI
METSSIDIRSYKAQIEKKIQHVFLDKYIPKPVIDDEKLTILTTIINHSDVSDQQKQRYIVTAMLAQTALDTHDTVPAHSQGERWSIANQLKVLAGDYYSGLYYLLLSEIDDFEFIHILASAIKEINEIKMKIYQSSIGTFQDLMDMREEMEFLLLQHVAQFLGDSFPPEVAGKWLVTNKLIRQTHKPESGELSFSDVWMEQAASVSGSYFVSNAKAVVRENLRQLEILVGKIPESHRLYREYLHSVIRQHNYNEAR